MSHYDRMISMTTTKLYNRHAAELSTTPAACLCLTLHAHQEIRMGFWWHLVVNKDCLLACFVELDCSKVLFDGSQCFGRIFFQTFDVLGTVTLKKVFFFVRFLFVLFWCLVFISQTHIYIYIHNWPEELVHKYTQWLKTTGSPITSPTFYCDIETQLS